MIHSDITKGIINVILLMSYCAFIFWLSDQSTLPTPRVFNNEDKLLHLGAYFIMSLLAWRVFASYIRTHAIIAVATLVFTSLYGLSDEWHQYFVPGRHSSSSDWIADTLGAGLGVGLMLWLRNRKKYN